MIICKHLKKSRTLKSNQENVFFFMLCRAKWPLRPRYHWGWAHKGWSLKKKNKMPGQICTLCSLHIGHSSMQESFKLLNNVNWIEGRKESQNSTCPSALMKQQEERPELWLCCTLWLCLWKTMTSNMLSQITKIKLTMSDKKYKNVYTETTPLLPAMLRFLLFDGPFPINWRKKFIRIYTNQVKRQQ